MQINIRAHKNTRTKVDLYPHALVSITCSSSEVIGLMQFKRVYSRYVSFRFLYSSVYACIGTKVNGNREKEPFMVTYYACKAIGRWLILVSVTYSYTCQRRC